MELQHPLRADPDDMKVYFIADDGNETEIKVEDDSLYLAQLEDDVKGKHGLLTEKKDENDVPIFIINEGALVKLVHEATKGDGPPNRAKRAAQVANTIQPNVMGFKDAGEMFLQQVVYSPIAELFCAFSTSYCADRKVTCAHAVYCHEPETKNVPYSAACLPDAALRLVTDFYLIAMMELKCDGSGDPYKRDFYRCTLMTAMSLMAIADYLEKECGVKRPDIDIAIPFVRGNYQDVALYVMRQQGSNRPKIHLIVATVFWDASINSGKLDLISKLAVILARIVEITIYHKVGMAEYFRNKYNSNADAMKRNAITDPSSTKSSSRNSDTVSSKRSALGNGRNTSTTAKRSPSDNENAAKIAASCFGLVQGLEYPFPRVRELVMFDDDTVQSQREADFNFFQQESPFYFHGISTSNKNQTNQGIAVFCKVWHEGDRHTSRKNIKAEIQVCKRVNENNVPSPHVIDCLTALDVTCMTHLDKFKPSVYHLLVTQYHPNDVVNENDILVFVFSFVQAVQKLHAIGILHCDIKPSNILWDATQKLVRLIDFEHAQEEESAQWYTTTRKYEAPEISLGKPHTRMSDAYSVGKTLDAVIKEFSLPVGQDIANVIESLLIESDIKRMTLAKVEQQLENHSGGIKSITVTGLAGSNCLSTKLGREEVGAAPFKSINT